MADTRKAGAPVAEQILLIDECYQSGITDTDWCRENVIAVTTFYNCVNRCWKVAMEQNLKQLTVILKFPSRNRTWSPLTLFRLTFQNSITLHSPLRKEKQTRPVCGTQIVTIGEDYSLQELEFIPAASKIIEYFSPSYGCHSAGKNLSILKSQ